MLQLAGANRRFGEANEQKESVADIFFLRMSERGHRPISDRLHVQAKQESSHLSRTCGKRLHFFTICGIVNTESVES